MSALTLDGNCIEDLKGQERQQFINLISEFPNLFIGDYSHIRRNKRSHDITHKIRRFIILHNKLVLDYTYRKSYYAIDSRFVILDN